MPSVNSSSMPIVGASSTVMTPSLPTLSKASAMTSPILASCAEIVATLAISVRSSTSRAALPSASATAVAAASMPRLSASGLAPAATLRRPSATIAWASTVAVVVPSPATSLVLVATSLASCAPRFSVGSSSSISRATVTPSLVIVGAPHFLSMTTLRPFGPSVTLTASASLSTPRSSARRASSSKSRLLAMQHLGWSFLDDLLMLGTQSPPGLAVQPIREREMRSARLLLDNREHVAGGEHEVLIACVLHFGAAVLAVKHDIANLDVHRNALGASVVEPAWSNGDDFAFLWLLLGGVRDYEPGRGGLLGIERAHNDPVVKRLDNNLGGGRHDLTSPSGKG